MPHRRRSTPALVGDAEAEAEALNLKLAGLPYREIAKTQGCSVSTAHDRVQRALASIVPADKVDELRKIENERLNLVVHECLQVAATTDSPDTKLAALGRLTKASERIAKLNGLDIPVVQKVEVTNVDQLDAEIEQLMAELGHGS